MEDLHIARFDGPAWGVGDLLMIDGVEVYLMWFTTAHALEEVRSILRGEHLDMLYGQLYPTGRLATILDLKPLFVRGDFLRDMQQEVRPYPEALSRALVEHHLGGLWDTETFDRAVSRGEVLLYHQALEHGLDCFLQALFALNHVYFPSRKRTLSFLQGFAMQPADCGDRLLKIVRLGAEASTLPQSYAAWQALLSELRQLAK